MKPLDIRNHISQQCGFKESSICSQCGQSRSSETHRVQCGFTPNKAKHSTNDDLTLSEQLFYSDRPIEVERETYTAIQVCNAGAMPESFEDWLGGDSIDIGGNWTPDKLQANHDQYDNERHPFS